ncbi:MAG: 1-acyl-sn-glycerol-3-phosphate acyltransferase [Bacteroidia bacterium]|nr:1-acyl-sn-glycerol-3-phosphate acyltransferase [Bacteroidia bacterium]
MIELLCLQENENGFMIWRILRFIFGLWAVLVFASSLLISGVLYFIIFSFAKEAKAHNIAHQMVSRNWARFLFILFGIRTKIRNVEVLDKSKVYVFAANHRSLLDIPAYAIACPHSFRFLAKAELMKIPVLGYIIRRLYISVERKSKAARVKSMENMNRSIRDGISVFICPEGTRNKTENLLLNFHDGAFRLAISAQVPLAVLTILHSGKLLSPGRPIELKPGLIECVWSKPIETIGMTEEDIPMLRQKTIELMEGELRKAKS